MNQTPAPLSPERLRRLCDPASLGFKTTAELEPTAERIGQDDALEAVSFGLSVKDKAYNIFAVGSPGSGRATMIRQLVAEQAREEPAPSDWCYVYNFDAPREPRALELPAGRGPELDDAIDALLDELRTSLPRALRSGEFERQRERILEESLEEQRRIADEFKRKVGEDPFAVLIQTPAGLVVVPARGNEPISEDHLLSLPKQQQEEILSRREELEKEFAAVRARASESERAAHRRIVELQRQVAQSVVGVRMQSLKRDWHESPEVVEHLNRLGKEIVKSADRFTASQEETQEAPFLPIDQDVFSNFRVNVIVARNPEGGAPLVEEANLTHHNLLGRIEHRVLFGIMVADFREIWGGALHEANGGYLILETSDLLRQPFAWIGLKKALQTQSVRPEEFGEYTGATTTSTLRPQPIPLQCKVILIGDPYTYLLLRAYDEDFETLFKVKADFRSYMERGRNEERAYASFVAQRCREESLPPFDASAIARIVEHGSRVAGHQSRLTTRFELIADLIREAVYYAGKESSETVSVGHVGRAIAARERRVGRPERELLQLIEEDVLAVDPSGEGVGQLYGLAVLSSADHTFARPIKLEASAFMGTSGVVDIEREVRLGGPLHNKGVLVLSGYLGDLFAQHHPLILSATVSFDQLYDEVEGDSASAAELFALVSAIAGVPIKQGIAITGALNQKGEIQPIGGVTTKIEGFFRACQRRGLTGEQGVIIPARNLSNLVLNDEVIAAVQEGAFSIWPIRHVDEGWQILTGMAAGEKDAHGAFPADTVYGRAAKRLREWATGWREFGSPVREGRQKVEAAGADAEPEQAE